MSAHPYVFPGLQDNYGVLLHDEQTGATAAIDAPEAGAVEAALQRTGWRLSEILVTHHHADHTGGISALKERHHCRVTAPFREASRIPLVDATVREGALIARRVLNVCRRDAETCVGADVPIAVSIGVAQWTGEIGAFPDRLIAAADHALYAAKNDGKNRHAVYDPAPPLAPGHETMPEHGLRKHA